MLLPKAGLILLAVSLFAARPVLANNPDPISANQNRAPAGVLRNGVLTLKLEARVGMWRPQADIGGGVAVAAFGEVGKALQIPGPLVRTRAGTRIKVSLHNRLAETLVVYGLHARPGSEDDTLHIPAGVTRTVEFDAGAPGTYYYWGTTAGQPIELRDGDDSQLTGAFVVDPAEGPVATDRVFVIGLWFQPEVKTGAEAHPEREIMVINGKSWPDTERFHFTAGDSVRWRWINATASSHPMHLHGFYFQVGASGNWAASQSIPRAQRPLRATQLMLQGETMDIDWMAEREGNWVFHCHFAFHVSNELYLAPHAAEHGDHGDKNAPHAMAGLVLGMHVAPNPKMVATKSSEPARQLRLIVQQRTDTTTGAPPFGYALSEDGAEPQPESLRAPGPLLVLRRGQPVAITVVNRLAESTAVHWHGIELESFPDGVPGWSGTPARIMPPIAPQDSFVAEFVPPRSGTFIYHSHSNELAQILGGLVGPLVVLDDATQLPADEIVFLVSASSSSIGAPGLVNGERRMAPRHLVAGKTYRFRLINIGDWRVFFSLVGADSFPSVKMVAKDGADLAEPVAGALNMLTGPGETGDFEVTLPAGDYRMEFKMQVGGWITSQDLKVR
jgi:manganese oxidase